MDSLRVVARRVDSGSGALNCRQKALTTPWRRFEGSRFNTWKRSMRALGLVPPVSMRRLDLLLDGFRPEVVLCVMQHAAYYDAAWRFARLKGLPLVTIVHDVNDQFEPVLPFAAESARRRDGEFYRYASRRLCVSPEMEALCAKRYGVAGDVLYPNRSEELQPRSAEESKELKRPGVLSVGFVGNLNYGYGEELLRLLPAFRGAGVRLVIFSNPPGGKARQLIDARDVCDFRGFAPAMDAWRAIKSACDAVILPYPNPAGSMETLYRHHFPSKLPEYLALGMPVIVTGPAFATGVKWALRNPEAAVVNSSLDATSLTSLLGVLRTDSGMRYSLATGAVKAGMSDFDPGRIKADFLRHLTEAVQCKARPQ